MPQQASVSIRIGETVIKQFSSLSLSQGIFEHHTFRLVCPADAIDKASGGIFDTSKTLVSGNFILQIKAIEATGNLEFAGVVTQVETARHSGHSGDVIISGYSPTILPDNGPHCKTWEKKTLKDIAADVLSHFPENLIQPQIAPLFSETLSYTVQYKETAWQFLSRLSATYGEWLFYDGRKLVLGPPMGSEVNLMYDHNLSSFNMMMQVRPAKFQMKAYNYLNSEVYNGTPKSIAGQAGLNDLGQYALQKSEQFFGTQPKQWHNQFLTGQKQLDDFANTRAVMQSSNMIRFNGNSDHPGVQVGSTIRVQGKNVYGRQDESFGTYRIISVQHYCDGENEYSNDFVAIPASVKVPPVTSYAQPTCETQSAFVTDNHDTKGLGRIRVRFHWMNAAEKTPWLRVISPHGGGGKGMYFIPEIGEEVIVGFEGDSPTKPYIIGTVFHGKAKNESGNSGNDVKALQTRSGSKIVMNDKAGSIHIADAKGNNMMMDGAGNIHVKSSESIVLTCGESKIEMTKDGTINITGKKITTTAQESAKMMSGQASFTADGQGNEANMEGVKSNVTGSAETKIQGGASTEVSAGGNVAVKAALITLN